MFPHADHRTEGYSPENLREILRELPVAIPPNTMVQPWPQNNRGCRARA